MKNNTIRFLLIGFGFSLLLILVSSVASFISINRLVESSAIVNKANAVSLNLENLISNMKDAETGYRGYIITRDSSFLHPYYGSYDRVRQNYEKVVELSADNPVQQQYLKELLPLITQRFKRIETGLAEGLDIKVTNRSMGEGKKIMDQIRVLVDKMEGEEDRLLVGQNETIKKYASVAPVLVIGAAILSLLVMALAFGRIRAGLAKSDAMQEELIFQNDEKEKRAAELSLANKELAFQNDEKAKRADELSIANKELAFQNDEKEKRAAELSVANAELAFQNDQKEKRADELSIANKELAFQNDEKEKRAAELSIANKELAFQNDEKEKRAEELSVANKELAFQNDQKEKRAEELSIANKELAFQNDEKENRAAELIIANEELAFQNDEKEKLAAYLKERVAIISNVAEKISAGNYTTRIDEDKNDKGELGDLARALNQMAEDLEENFTKLDKQAWLQQGVAELNDQLKGEKNPAELTQDVLAEVVQHLGATVGVLYLSENDTMLRPVASYASNAISQQTIAYGQGLVGQVASDKAPRILQNVPSELFRVSSGLLEGTHASVIIYPLVYNNVLQGVIELGLVQAMPEMTKEYLEIIVSNIAIAIYAANNRLKLQELLQETQAQSEELRVQQDELQHSNAELEMQSQKLQASEEELRVQQEELMQSNQDLEEKAQLLEEKNQFIEQKSRELTILNDDVEIKNKELEQASRYKSEFLANMSHELRTPLNSILLLAKLLAESKELDLGDDRYEYAKVIHGSGMGLLELINEILDLSKIEAGQMQILVEDVPFEEIKKDMAQMFQPLANERKLELKLDFSPDLPEFIQSDKQRLEQILKNLLSNAIKFTEKGTVSLEVTKVDSNTVKFSNEQLNQVPAVAFIVKDTGIGIPQEQQGLVFEAFKQVDGTSRRKYGGTGLGLSISREISRLLGGEIQLESVEGQGSTFIVYLPLTYTGDPDINISGPEKTVASEVKKVPSLETKPIATEKTRETHIQVSDDRYVLSAGDKAILIVEDDVSFVKALSPFVKASGYKVLVATRGNDALELARKYQPVGILLDVNLPVMDGWNVIDHLKQDFTTRHIPVHIMSSDEARHKSLEHGAIDFISKPLAQKDLNQVLHKMEVIGNQSVRQLLIIEENIKHAAALSDYFKQNKIDTGIALTKEEGLNRLKSEKFDGVILDITDTEQMAFKMLDQIKQNKSYEKLPVIIYTGNTITAEDENRINKYAATSIVKKANTFEKLLNEVSIFLHLVDDSKSRENRDKRKNKLLDRGLEGKTILIADDDERNIYSLKKVLELQDAKVITAVNGKQAMERLTENPEIDALLIDIMMPEMDGYETIKTVRQQQKYKNLPIIAVTAKTMPNDRNMCIEAGASDYISKPVDMDQLLSLLKVWLY